jgi:hypothetical protein
VRTLTLLRGAVAALIILSPALAVAQQNTTTVLTGRVMVRDAGVPLPYASITINGKNPQFTDSAGRFHIEGIAGGDVTVRAKRIGFSPAEQVVRVNRGDTVRVMLQLTRLAIQLPAMHSVGRVCTDPGAPDRKSDPGLVQLYEQLQQNAEHFRLLSAAYPYVYISERQFVRSYKDSVTERTALEQLSGTSARTWKYEPGKMVFENKTTNLTNMHLPTLATFAEESFARSHCFEYAGLVELDGVSLIRVDFTPDEKIKEPDVSGSIFLDPRNYQIRRSEIQLTRVPYALSGQITGHTVTTYFAEIIPGIPIIGAFKADVMRIREGEVMTELQRVVEVQFLAGKPQ